MKLICIVCGKKVTLDNYKKHEHHVFVGDQAYRRLELIRMLKNDAKASKQSFKESNKP